MRPPTRESTAPMCDPSSTLSKLSAIRLKSEGFMRSPDKCRAIRDGINNIYQLLTIS